MRIWAQEGIEVFVSAPTSGGFARHSHDEFVISANVCGVEQVRLDRRRFTLGTDELTLYNPGEVQSCKTSVNDDERWSCASIYLDPDVVSRRLGYDAEFHAPVVTAPQLRAQLLQIALAPTDASTPHRVEQLLYSVFGVAPLGRTETSLELERAEAWLFGAIAQDPVEPLRVADVAAHLGWTRETFTRRFTETTGTPPYAWHLQARLRKARRLLSEGRAPSEVTTAVGFVDQAHLHKHFQAVYATTPGQFRATHLGSEVYPENHAE
ncbi:transcriptional regulator, AraC family [Kribbella flavida DSM 17836]|uniref:Transcriptional regulator, AraC family n=1 Tax=Kribbella flavida (strain DSM 17836 / JCM 10339 / NBRC 14399) TaxID=479435 RepID=D2PS31_KRIFD|nr:AraC family transcriptional regulator [Kribbella flavida]ADB31155.1 transcriptional regulator, AraC family [Kribbella flavida DSM 17836]